MSDWLINDVCPVKLAEGFTDEGIMKIFKTANDFFTFLRIYETGADYNVYTLRFFYLAGLIFYPIFGWMFHLIDPSLTDSVFYRFLILSPVIFAFIYSFTKKGSQDIHFLNFLLDFTAGLVAIQSFYFIIVNDINSYYLAGGFLALFVLTVIVSHWKAILFISFISIFSSVIAVIVTSQSLGIKIFYLLGSLLYVIFSSFSLTHRIIMAKKMHDNEEKFHQQEMNLLSSSKMALLGEITASIMHEIKNPLAIMQLNLDLFKKQIQEIDESQIHDDNQKNEEIVEKKAKFEKIREKLSENLTRVNLIIENLKSYSHLPAVQEVGFEKVSLKNFLRSIEEIALLKAKKVNGKFEIVNHHTESTFDGQFVPLFQVVTNLINNSFDAIEFLSEKWVKLDVDQDNSDIWFMITDSGRGIPKVIAEKMFQKFFTTKPVGKGTGLGLSISKQIIEKHNGTLELDLNSPYTKFVIRFPKKRKAFDSGNFQKIA